MRINKNYWTLLLSFLLAILVTTTYAQEEQVDDEQTEEYKAKVTDMISFLEYFLNTLGNSSTSARDKDVIIQQSYTKIFRDSKVQIEDDLDENRDVITNKDVQAYLKDVDFFFKNVNFDFNIEDISHYVNENGELFFKVSLVRHLQGIGIEGDSIDNTQKRYIEINLDPEAQDLKIASVYTNPYDRKEALSRWWNALSFEWKSIFTRKAGLADSVSESDIRNIAEIEELDVSGHQYIVDLAPLSQLTNLRRLNVSNTQISDLKPIRNLTNLEELNISHTEVNDLEPLRYASLLRYLELQETPVSDMTVASRLVNLQSLDITHSHIEDLSPLSELKNLKVLKMGGTPVSTLEPINHIPVLEELDVTGTTISQLDPVEQMKNLQIIKADSTPLTSIEPLAQATALSVLSINSTSVSSLQPLDNLPQLERVYCDLTKITKSAASDFMARNPEVLVIFESDDLKNWWLDLPLAWKSVFEEFFQIRSAIPSKEELAKITSMDSLQLTDNTFIQNIEPVSKLRELKTLIIVNSSIADLTPLEGLRTIEYLDISGNPITNFKAISSLTNLKVLKANNTNISNFDDIMDLQRLSLIEVDQTLINKDHVLDLLENHPATQVIFQTEFLTKWWSELNASWRGIFETQVAVGMNPSKEQLHRLIMLESIKFKDIPVKNLQPLKDFLRLKEVRFSGTAINDLSPLVKFSDLEILQANRSPINEIDHVSRFKNLRILDISNTPVDDLRPIEDLFELRDLNCSGTQVKNLKALDNLSNLTILDCSNTRVRRLDRIDHLNLKNLKCYNTRISSRKVEKFKDKNPDCIVTYY